ncbi:CoA-binding protein [Actinomadura sp. ATCC 31491]|uniref:CoA-binding protein n=1 Tax=Actinomadura luzonensis TaxID=2805427 RepID=A0ABT0G6U8_9ACTN|nr:CoA-binding protein [Actinomadura luzonensis]MCK2220297.1 CoA-binding protein [Actinomadura luzonensis]
MSNPFADENVIRRLLADTRTWAFVGLSDNPERTAYDQAGLLQRRGKRIVPVHPAAATVLGEPGYATLAEVPGPVDVVAIYRRAEVAGESVDEAIAIGARAVWLPLGVVDEAAARRALDAGLDVVMDRCPGVEWALRRTA